MATARAAAAAAASEALPALRCLLSAILRRSPRTCHSLCPRAVPPLLLCAPGAAAPGDHLHTHCAAASQARPLCCCLCSRHSRHSRLSGAADAADAAATPQPPQLPLPTLLVSLLSLWVCMPRSAPLSAPASRLHHPRTPHPLQLCHCQRCSCCCCCCCCCGSACRSRRRSQRPSAGCTTHARRTRCSCCCQRCSCCCCCCCCCCLTAARALNGSAVLPSRPLTELLPCSTPLSRTYCASSVSSSCTLCASCTPSSCTCCASSTPFCSWPACMHQTPLPVPCRAAYLWICSCLHSHHALALRLVLACVLLPASLCASVGMLTSRYMDGRRILLLGNGCSSS